MKKIIALALLLSFPAHADAPGSLNPAVTQDNIHQTICVHGWSASVRPPAAYTTKLKIQQLRAQGLKGVSSDYEEDHMIPLSIGGHPTDPNNLWPQPWPEARQKDEIEFELYKRVCARNNPMPLADAQKAVLDWRHWHKGQQTTIAP